MATNPPTDPQEALAVRLALHLTLQGFEPERAWAIAAGGIAYLSTEDLARLKNEFSAALGRITGD